jgi:DNA-binding transcriptional LysR family regulator
MNVHHLELFYFVAKFEGITEAVRNMPYGIQQPAVSGQISKLEKFLGVKLFQRRPFALTPAGEELYDFIYPFFSRLDQMTERLRGEESHHLRLAASAAALTHHLPEVLQALRAEFPTLRLTLRELHNPDIEVALRKMEADVAIAILHRKSTPGLKSVKLIDIPLAIAVPASSPINKFRDLTARAAGGLIQHPLIALPRIEPASQLFQQGLTARNLRWEPSMEVSELGLIQNYVAKGFGFGIAVDIPGAVWPDEVKKIPLPKDFPPLTIGALHTGDLKTVAKRFIGLAGEQANTLLDAKKVSTKSAKKT